MKGKIVTTIIASNKGQGMIQLLMTLAIIGTVASATTTMISNLQKQQFIIERKYEKMDVKNDLELSFAKVSTCDCHFQGKSVQLHSVNANTNGPNQLVNPVSISELKAGCLSSDKVLVKAGQNIENSRTGLKVSDVELLSMEELKAGVYKGRVAVHFENNRDLGAEKPLFLTKVFNVSNGSIDSCTDKITESGGNPNCSAGETVVVGSNGTKECVDATQTLTGLNCADGETIAFQNGQITCSSGPATTTTTAQTAPSYAGCPSQQVWWGSSCFGSLPSANHGTVRNAGYSLEYKGYQCNNGTWQPTGAEYCQNN